MKQFSPVAIITLTVVLVLGFLVVRKQIRAARSRNQLGGAEAANRKSNPSKSVERNRAK